MLRSILVLLLIGALSGCSGLVSHKSGQQTISSSLSTFLYPKNNSKVKIKPQIPVLKLPVKVGLAFLPSDNWRANSFDESSKYKLLTKVKESFGKHQYIDSISIIPSAYLRNKNLKGSSGFDVLSQLSRLHDVDVIALVSYDQLTQSHHNNASLLYWTIVGLYVIPGNENSIQTFVDTAVFDIRSRNMLMRAPGVSKLKKRSTAIGVDSVMNEKSMQGFDLAFDDMIVNLDAELARFRERAKKDNSVKIQHRQGYTGGGAFGFILLALLLLAMSKGFRGSN
jgi:rhombotail lipoprotein